MSSSPQTPRDGAALPAAQAKPAADFDFDTLAASFLNYQVDAFENPTFSIPPAPATFNNQYNSNNTVSNVNDVFADFSSFINAPLEFFGNGNGNVNSNNAATGNSPPLQNAFRTFSNSYDGAAPAFVPGSTYATAGNGSNDVYRKSPSSSSASSSPLIASPAFDAAPAFPFGSSSSNNNKNLGNGAIGFAGAKYGIADFNSPNLSGVDTPALVADDGSDLVASLTTSPMWGQLDLAGISLFPQQQQQTQAQTQARAQAQTAASAPVMPATVHRTSFSAVQQAAVLPTISPKELSMSLPHTSPQFITGASMTASPLVQSMSAPVAKANTVAVAPTSAPATKSVLKKSSGSKRSRQSPAFGGDDDSNDEESEDDEEMEAAARSGKKARRSTSVHFTGSRNGSTPLLPLDAPTQARTYRGPESKTSKRAVPAAAARKVAAIKAQAEMQKRARRSVSVADPAAASEQPQTGGGADEEDEEVHEAIEMSIEAKRRQNTIAARRSRQRKAEHLSGLEESIRALTERVAQLENEKTVWMMRALAAGWTEDSRAA